MRWRQASIRDGQRPKITSFLAIYRPHFARIWQIITHLNSANFSIRRIKQISGTWNKFFVGLKFPHLGFLTSVGCDPKRHTFGVYAFHRYHWFAVKLRLYRWNRCFLALAPLMLKKLPEFFMTAFHTTRRFMGLPPRSYRSVVYNWCYGAFKLLQKPSRFRLAWSRPCTDPKSQIEPITVFRECSIRSLDKFHSDRSTLWENGSRKKTCFRLITEDGRADGAWQSIIEATAVKPDRKLKIDTLSDSHRAEQRSSRLLEWYTDQVRFRQSSWPFVSHFPSRSCIPLLPGCHVPPLIGGGIKRCFCLTSVCLTSVCGVHRA